MASVVTRAGVEFEEIRPNIFIPSEKTDSACNNDVKILIEQIETNPIGRRLLEKIRLSSSEVFIGYGKRDKCAMFSEKDSNYVIISLSKKDFTCFSARGESIPFPKHVKLFHELTHAHHYFSGKRAMGHLSDPLVWENDEEYKTIMGFPSKKGKTTPKITENAFRRAEGLPERFGSWDPSGSSLRSALCAARIKILGAMHEKSRSFFPENFAPPPIALCSVKDLGSVNRCLVYTKIHGVDIKYNPKDKISNFFWIDPSNFMASNIGDTCYHRPPNASDLDSMRLKSLAAELFPELENTIFKVCSMVILRVSQYEIDVISSFIS